MNSMSGLDKLYLRLVLKNKSKGKPSFGMKISSYLPPFQSVYPNLQQSIKMAKREDVSK